jgi:glycolate oxidase iron-sulfur subunit
MRAIQEGRLPLRDTTVRHIDLCLGCRACEAACPSGVQYGALLESTRDHIEKRHRRSWFQTILRRYAIERVFPFPSRMRLALLPAKAARKLRLQALLPKWASDALELIPENGNSSSLPELSPAAAPDSKGSKDAEGRVGFVRGCVMSVLFGETNKHSVQLLNRAGYDVVTPAGQRCCGALFAHSGRLDQAREYARHNIAVFERFGLDAVIINAAGCGSTLKEYGHLLGDDPAWADRAHKFSAKVKDLTEWLQPEDFARKPLAGAGAGVARGGNRIKVTYHDACHLAHPQRITRQPRELVKALAGGNFVELPESDVCCGSAGSYNLTEPEMAERLQRRKSENILRTGAQVVVTTNPGCMLQIRAGLRKAGADQVRVVHIADYLGAI